MFYSLFGDPNQTWIYTQFPSKARTAVLLWRWGKPQTLLSVQVPLQAVLLGRLTSLLCILVELPCPASWGLYLAMSRVMNYFPCLDAVGEAVWEPLNSVVLTQDDPYPRFPEQTGPLTFLSKLLAQPALPLATQLPGILLSSSSQMETGTQLVNLCLSSLGRTGNGCSRLSGWEGLKAILIIGYELIYLPM